MIIFKINFTGGETIIITGNNFNNFNNEVYFGTVLAKFISLNSTNLVVISPSMPPGSYSLIIRSNSAGNTL